MIKRIFTGVVVCALQLASTSIVHADTKDLIAKLPADANCIVAVDVDALLASPVATKEAWAQQRQAREASNTSLYVPVATKDLILAGLLDLQSMDTTWQMSLLEMNKNISMKNLALSAGENVDSIAGLPAVSAEDFIYVQIAPTILGTVKPANRQVAARWVGNSNPGGISKYLQAAAGQIGSQTQIVMALDLDGATSPERVKRRLIDRPNKALLAKQIDLDAVAKLFGGIKGVTLTVSAGDRAQGKAVIDFSSDPSVLGAATKDSLLEFLSHTGMYLPDFSVWEFTTDKNQIIATGPLSTSGVRHLLSVLETPATENATAVDNWQKPEGLSDVDPQKAPAVATQKYFASVSQIIDGLSTGDSMSQLAGWAGRDAKRIDKLPILNVDPEVAKFGAYASDQLRQITRLTYVGQVNAGAAASGVSSPVINYGAYDSNGQWAGGMTPEEASATIENANRQRRQVSQQQRAQTMDAAGQVFEQIRAARNQVKIQMTEKYHVEF